MMNGNSLLYEVTKANKSEIEMISLWSKWKKLNLPLKKVEDLETDISNLLVYISDIKYPVLNDYMISFIEDFEDFIVFDRIVKKHKLTSNPLRVYLNVLRDKNKANQKTINFNLKVLKFISEDTECIKVIKHDRYFLDLYFEVLDNVLIRMNKNTYYDKYMDFIYSLYSKFASSDDITKNYIYKHFDKKFKNIDIIKGLNVLYFLKRKGMDYKHLVKSMIRKSFFDNYSFYQTKIAKSTFKEIFEYISLSEIHQIVLENLNRTPDTYTLLENLYKFYKVSKELKDNNEIDFEIESNFVDFLGYEFIKTFTEFESVTLNKSILIEFFEKQKISKSFYAEYII